MNFTELQSEVATVNLGRSDSTSLTYAGKAINYTLQEDLVARGLKPFLTSTTVTTTADQEYVDLPSGFMGLKWAGIQQSDNDYDLLTKMDWDDYEAASATGEPDNYDILPGTSSWRMYLRLTPDDAYTIKIWYLAKPSALSGSTTSIVSTLYGDTPIISGATWRLAVMLGIDAAIARWRRQYIDHDLKNLLRIQDNLRGAMTVVGRSPVSPYK